MANVSGTVKDCNGNAVSNGHVILQKDGNIYRYPLSGSGTFNLTTAVCNNTNTAFISLMVENNTTLQTGDVIYDTVTAGNNVVALLSNCFTPNNSNQEFIDFSIDSTNYSIVDSIGQGILHANIQNPFIYFTGWNLSNTGMRQIEFSTRGILAKGSTFVFVDEFNCKDPGYDRLSSNEITVNITECGEIGKFIAGNFKCEVHYFPGQDYTPHKASCSFRIRRRV